MHFYLKIFTTIACMAACILPHYGQQQLMKTISMDEAVKIALAHHPAVKNAELSLMQIKNSSLLTDINLKTTELYYAYGQMYSATKDEGWGIKQDLGSPVTHIQNIKYHQQLVKYTEAEQKLTIKQLVSDVKTAYNNFLYQFNKVKVIHQVAPIYDQLLSINGTPYDLRDTIAMEKIKAETLFASFQNKQFQAEQEYKIAHNQLQLWINSKENLAPADSILELYAIEIQNIGPDKFSPTTHFSFYNQLLNLRQKETSLEASKLFPEFSAGYFNHKIEGVTGFQGFMFGISVPLWYFPQKRKVTAARRNKEIAQNEADYQKFCISKKIENLRIQLDQAFVLISFYRENALKQAELLIEKTINQVHGKNINYAEGLDQLRTALEIQLEYLDKLKLYNDTAIQLEHYID